MDWLRNKLSGWLFMYLQLPVEHPVIFSWPVAIKQISEVEEKRTRRLSKYLSRSLT
jgi:hypothetical protein